MKASYEVTEHGDFVIQDYNRSSSFTSFLPGIAGLTGKPLWAYYANRGQCITSFGVSDKDHAILEFHPANKALHLVSTHGFRTFVKTTNSFCEPFAESLDPEIRQTMTVRPHELEISEENPKAGFNTSVTYFTLPEYGLPALVRKLVLTNRSNAGQDVEVLDGLPVLTPAYFPDDAMKTRAYSHKARVKMLGLESDFLYSFTRLSKSDGVADFGKEGNFYFGLAASKGTASTLPVCCDPARIFNADGSFAAPLNFMGGNLNLEDQQTVNHLPSAFSCFNGRIEAGESVTIYSLAGHARTEDEVLQLRSLCEDPSFLDKSRERNRITIDDLQDTMFTASADPTFDNYCRHTYLDNLLRGGVPKKIGRHVFHVFHRVHGDHERDYGEFNLDPVCYSQGNGSYRDINQNRRCDAMLSEEAGRANIYSFFNTTKLDGNNPRNYGGVYFEMRTDSDNLVSEICATDSANELSSLLSEPFTPGSVWNWLEEHDGQLKIDRNEALTRIIDAAEKKENFFPWNLLYSSDFWHYNLDLLENYELMYPEKISKILFESSDFTFFDTYDRIVPTKRRYVWDNELQGGRQYQNCENIEEKQEFMAARQSDRFVVRSDAGKGDIYGATLAEMLICTVCTKMAALDPDGIGVQMLYNRPNWNDSMTGLPPLLGSSLSETAELLRHIRYLAERCSNRNVAVAEEIGEFASLISNALKQHASDKRDTETRDRVYWNAMNEFRDDYTEKTLWGLSGRRTELDAGEISELLSLAEQHVMAGIDKARDDDTGLYRNYFYYDITKHEPVKDADGNQVFRLGLPVITPLELKRVDLPLYLEAQVKMLRVIDDPAKAAALCDAVRNSALYDRALQMYKVSDSIQEFPDFISHCKSFARGWLENESIFLHMMYKYLLEILRAGMYEKFFTEIRTCLVPFFDAETYGRSPLEHSSVVVSSVYPDAAMHGRGFYPRMTGTTAEVLSMYNIMAGLSSPFSITDDGSLSFTLNPILPDWLFTETESVRKTGENDLELPANCFCCTILGKIRLLYHNEKRLNTFGNKGVSVFRIELTDMNGASSVIEGSIVTGEDAEAVRNGKIVRIDAYLE